MTAIIFGMRPIIADNHGSVRLAVLSFSYDGDGLMTAAEFWYNTFINKKSK